MEAFSKSPKRCLKIILVSFHLGKQSLVERGDSKKILGLFGEIFLSFFRNQKCLRNQGRFA